MLTAISFQARASVITCDSSRSLGCLGFLWFRTLQKVSLPFTFMPGWEFSSHLECHAWGIGISPKSVFSNVFLIGWLLCRKESKYDGCCFCILMISQIFQDLGSHFWCHNRADSCFCTWMEVWLTSILFPLDIGTSQKKEFFFCAEKPAAARAWVATLRWAGIPPESLNVKIHKKIMQLKNVQFNM